MEKMVSCGCYMSMEKMLMRFSMNTVIPTNIPLAFHCNFCSILYHDSMEGNGYMSHVPYTSRIGRLMFVMEF
jgi:hypothetical protein